MEGAVLDAPDHPKFTVTGSASTPALALPSAKADRSITFQPELVKFTSFGGRTHTHWSDLELNSSLQAERDPFSAPPTPSLSSSGISSIQSTTHGCCPTPEVFPGATRLPLRGSKAKHHGFFGASGFGHWMLMDSEYEPFRTASRSGSSMPVPRSYRIADTRGRDVDWTHWDPTKYQCNFCRERFLKEFDLQTHLRTHKRYRRLLKEETSHINNNPKSGIDAVENLRRASLTSLDDSCSRPLSQHMYSDDTRSLENDLSDRACEVANTAKSEQDTFSKTSGGDAVGCVHIHHGLEGATIERASTSALSLHARGPPSHLHPTKCGIEDPDGSVHNYNDYSEDVEEMVSSKDLSDCVDTSIFVLELDVHQKNENVEGFLMLKSSLVSMKEKMILRIMDEFMVLLKETWTSRTRTHGNAPGETPNGAYQSESRTSSQVSSNNRRRQTNGAENSNERSGEGDGDGDGEDDDQRAPKRIKASSFAANDNPGFACPYRKYDPRKYCVRNWRTCALTPLENVARVKAHLYRHHRIFQCPRCKSLFLNQNILDEHILAPEGCIPNRVNLAEGVTADIEKRLRSRKKTYPHQTEADRWEEIYRMLFRTAIVPRPFFEPVEESVEQLSDSTKLAEFEQYTQKELPRIFWAALEKVVTKEMQPVEERLRTQLMDMIQNCQHQVFSTYQSMANSTLDTLMGDNFIRDRLSGQFGPLSRVPATGDQLASVDRAASSNDISAFNSSTTLSSIFRSSTTLNSNFTSSTTLSSIASSQTSPQIQSAGGGLCGVVEEGNTGAFGIDDKTMSTTDMGQTDFWMTDLEDMDASEFGMDNVWGAGT